MKSIPLIDGYVTLVRHQRAFRYLWFSQVISLFGDWFNLIASAALVAKLSGSGVAIGGLFLARLLPPFLLSPFAGVVADRFDRRGVLITSDLLRVFVVLGFLLIQREQDIWLLYVLTVLQLSFSAFFEPARAALLPSLVAREDLVTANALSGTTWSTMLALGAALGGLATALFGVTAAFLIDTVTFILSAWFVSRIPHPIGATETDTATDGAGWMAFVEGLRYLRQRPTILAIALVKGSAALAFGGMNVVEVAFAEQIFPLGADGSGTLGLIYCITGLGTGLGPLLAQRLTGHNLVLMKWMILVAYVTMFVGYMLLGNTATLWLFLFGTFIRTAGSGINWVYSSSLLQMLTPDKFLGRVFAFDLAMATLGAALSTLWAGWSMDTLGLNPWQVSLTLGMTPVVMALGWTTFMIRLVSSKEFGSLR